MDGMLGHHAFIITRDDPGPIAGILYAEDFDELPTVQRTQPNIQVEPEAPALTQYDLDQACAAAVQDARAQWEREAWQQHRRMLATIAETAASVREQAMHDALNVAEGTVATMLSLLAGALPALCRSHGPEEARALVQHLLPSLRTEPRITVRVHPSLVQVIEEELNSADVELTGIVSVMGAPVEPGDVRVTWENGSFKRDTRATLAAMQDALSHLGLLSPVDLTPERRMEHAE
jgi:flagellar biosynthesis/type III secretory pathway protein FliH